MRIRFALVMLATARLPASAPRGVPYSAPAVYAYRASTAYSGATASTASTAIANERGTSASAVSAAHASRKDDPRTAIPLSTTVGPAASSPPEAQTPIHGSVNKMAAATATNG